MRPPSASYNTRKNAYPWAFHYDPLAGYAEELVAAYARDGRRETWMNSPKTITAANAPPKPLLAVAERWADFTKAMAIYPEANVRVGRALDALQQALADSSDAGHTDAGGHVRVIFTGSQILLGQHLHTPRPNTNLTWLRSRVERGALAGVGFLHDVDREQLVAFTKRLLGNHMRIGADSEFTSLWPERYKGVELIQRRFAGGFRRDSQEPTPTELVEEQVVRSWGDAGDSFLEEDTPEARLARSLWESRDVAIRVWLIERFHKSNQDALQLAEANDEVAFADRSQASIDRMRDELLAEIDEDIAPELSIDGKRLVRRIVQHMGSRLLAAEDTARRVAQSVLENLEDRIVWQDDANELEDALSDNTLGTLIASVSRQLFMRVDGAAPVLGGNHFERWAQQEKVEHDPKKAGHAGDDQITDDVASFLQELEKLPQERVKPISSVEVDIRAEQIGVLLHYLVSAEESEKSAALIGALEPLLDNLGPEERGVLRQYVDYFWSKPTENHDASSQPLAEERILAQDRLFRLFKRGSRTRLLREFGVLTASTAVAQFPQHFVTYFDSLNLSLREEAREFLGVVETIGAQRFAAAESQLTLGDGLATDARSKLIFELDTPEAAPLIGMLTRADCAKHRDRILYFLKKHDPRSVLRSVLSVVAQPAEWSVEWIRATLEPSPSSTQIAMMSRVSTLALCSLVRSAKGVESMHHRRLQAIHLLATHDASLAEPALRELLAWGKFPAFWNRENKDIRDAARFALQALRERSTSSPSPIGR